MRCVCGLLIKDWHLAKRYCWAYLPIGAAFAAIMVLSDAAWFATYPLLLGALLPLSLQAYDESSGFLHYAAVMPVSRRALVGARYLTAVLALLPGATLLGLAGLIGGAMGRPSPLDAAAVGLFSLLSLLLSCVLLPLAFRFGSERARLLAALAFGAFCVLVLLFSRDDSALLRFGMAGGRFVLPAVVPVLFALSYLLSVRLCAPRAAFSPPGRRAGRESSSRRCGRGYSA